MALRAKHPSLHLYTSGDGKCEVRGTYQVLSDDGIVVDEYRVAIELPEDYPRELPIVREIGGRIPWKIDFHVESDGKACVLLPEERWRVFPENAPFSQFLEGPMRDYFLGQHCVANGGKWPYGEWGHGVAGIYEYYGELLGTTDKTIIQNFVYILTKLSNKSHWACPCGSGRKIRKCCAARIAGLKEKIPFYIAQKSWARLVAELGREAKCVFRPT